MHTPRLEGFRCALLSAGLAPRDIRRLVTELREHCEDVEAELLASGMPPAQAASESRRRLGGSADLAGAALQELAGGRSPSALAVCRNRCVALFAPSLVGDSGGPFAKWGAAAGVSAVATLCMLLALHAVITLN